MGMANILGWIKFLCIREIFRMILDKVMANFLTMGSRSIKGNGWQGKSNKKNQKKV